MADNDTYDPRDALIALLRDCLDGEEFDAAVGLLDEVLANPGSTQATDRKLTADSFAWVMKEGRRNDIRSHAARAAALAASYLLCERPAGPKY